MVFHALLWLADSGPAMLVSTCCSANLKKALINQLPSITMNTLLPPDPAELSHIQRLCEKTEPYLMTDELDALFVHAFRESISWHQQKNSFYGALLAQEGFAVDGLQFIEDLQQLPFIHANFFKTHQTLSIDREHVVEHLTSSGTSGQKSQMFFDEWSIKSARRMVRFIYDSYGFITPEQEVNYLLFAYEPTRNFKVGTTNTNLFLTSFAPPREIFFALRHMSGSYEFDRFGTLQTLQKYEEQGLPVRIQGFPSFTYFTLKLMEEMDIRLKLHPDSLVLFGGGWKGYADQEISKDQLYAMLHERLGLLPYRIRDAYGSVEHSIPYIECSGHHLHVPVWSRLFVRDVKTLDVLGYGEPGMMNFITPYLTSVPAISVLMGDMGILHPPSDCSCGAQTPFFTVQGRAGMSKNKSCAISASELLKKRGV